MNLRPLLFLCLPAALLLSACDQAPAPQEQAPRLVKLFTVEDPAGARLREFPARLKATEEAELSFRIGGQLKTLNVLQGQPVKRGQLIASLDDADQRLRLRDRQASYDLANAQFKRIAQLLERQMISRSEYDQRKAALDSASAALSLARQELDYTRILAPFDGVAANTHVDNFHVVQAKQPIVTLQSGDSLDDADQRLRLRDRQASYDLANAQFKRIAQLLERQMISRAEYDQRKATLDSASAALSLARQELEYTSILAPFDAVVASTHVDNFQVVQAKQPVVTLQSGNQLDVLFQMPENLLTNLRSREENRDYHPSVILDSLPGREFEAVYKEHSTQPDPKTLTYQVTLSMPRPEGLNLLPGMSATVKVDLAQVSRDLGSRLLVPVEAVFSPDDSGPEVKQVWVAREQDGVLRLTARQVEVGQLSRNSIEVLSGIEPGEQIVAVGGAELEEGQAVRPWVRERGL